MESAHIVYDSKGRPYRVAESELLKLPEHPDYLVVHHLVDDGNVDEVYRYITDPFHHRKKCMAKRLRKEFRCPELDKE